jgi:hypothetical protein
MTTDFYRLDPQNALLFLEAQLEVFKQMQGQNENFHLIVMGDN